MELGWKSGGERVPIVTPGYFAVRLEDIQIWGGWIVGQATFTSTGGRVIAGSRRRHGGGRFRRRFGDFFINLDGCGSSYCCWRRGWSSSRLRGGPFGVVNGVPVNASVEIWVVEVNTLMKHVYKVPPVQMLMEVLSRLCDCGKSESRQDESLIRDLHCDGFYLRNVVILVKIRRESELVRLERMISLLS